jgi:N-acetylmuramoyl-L-alanine amidase-like protein
MIARRLITALLTVIAASFVWAVAPALSTTPYIPGGDDFSQRLPAIRTVGHPTARDAERGRGYGADGPVLYRSEPVVAPHRFDLVGVAGEMHALEFRARSAGEPWSHWVETDNGDPVYTGGAEEVQVRSRDVPIKGKLHYVNVSGDETTASGLLTSLRKTVNSAVIDTLGTPLASASSTKPHFISRAEWGANQKNGGCTPRVKPEYGKVKAGVIHHTVSTNTYTEAEAPSIVLGICRYHRNGNGWNDIGYNALVDRFGNLYEGRAGGLSRPVIGAQAEGFNSQTTGIATIADHRIKPPTKGEMDGIERYLSWKLSINGLDGTGTTSLLSAGGDSNRTPEGQRVRTKLVIGHSDLGFTECPGEALRTKLPQIRHEIQAQIAQDGTTSPPTEPPPRGDKGGKGGKGHGGGGGGSGGSPARGASSRS